MMLVLLLATALGLPRAVELWHSQVQAVFMVILFSVPLDQLLCNHPQGSTFSG